MKKSAAIVLALLAGGAIGLHFGFGGAAVAASDGSAPPVRVRLVHASAKVAPLALWVDGAKPAAPAVPYRKAGPWLTLPSGGHKLTVFPAKGKPKGDPLYTLDPFMLEGGTYTLVVCNPPSSDPYTSFLLHERTPPLAAAAQVRLFHALDGIERVSAWLEGGGGVADDLSYGMAGAYATAAPGNWTLVVRSTAGDETITFPPHKIEAAHRYTFVATGPDSKREAFLLTD